MEIKNMNVHELAVKTYKDLQLRKLARKQKAEYECKAMKIEAVIKANNRIYRLKNR